ncbi:hypothetical protein [Mycolicibacterium llatzerense]|uniref:hypothetical protein n=1 Tax=Mycolicibacterium llatzerense TaxID=280871 RepID=UPI0021B6E071|nr:hypothetical protein [Mycolicibacterium llatzerense]MCT7366681.1 hypothetical protein [Mycolicibacterium llatzerense]
MSALPKPDGWKDRYLLIGVVGAVTAVLFAYFGYLAVIAATHTHWLAATIGLCGAVVFGIITIGAIVQLTSAGTLRAHYDETGTTFGPPPAALWLLAMCVALGLGSGLYLLYGARVRDDLPALSSRDSGRLITLLVVSVIAIVMLLRNMTKGRPALTLSPQRIDYGFPGDGRFSIAWDDIVDITGLHTAKRKPPRPIIFDCADGTRAIITNASTWVPGGTSLYWLCRYYWHHPADRGELANGLALDRLAENRIPAA